MKTHSYVEGQSVLIVSMDKETKIDHVIVSVPGGYSVYPPIMDGEAAMYSWNEDDMKPIGPILTVPQSARSQ